jgi:Fic family protein
MKTEEEIRKRLENIKEYVMSVPKNALLIEKERISFAGSSGAIEVLEWVLEREEE